MQTGMRVVKRSAALAMIMGFLATGAAAQTETVLYSFCAQPNCADGSWPESSVTLDAKGNVYGTAKDGGPGYEAKYQSNGVVFELAPDGKERVLQFNDVNGAGPYSNLIFANGSLYGTTAAGGANYEHGTVFEVTSAGDERVLYSFCSQTNCADGSTPIAGLVADESGNLYGTTNLGGAQGEGTVFKVTPAGAGAETVLYSFCPVEPYCPDGSRPNAGLVLDRNGNLYGTTATGGEHDGGTVFKVTAAGVETVLYSFCFETSPYCGDGATPYAGVVLDANANLYGTTYAGGAHGVGTVFKVMPNGEERVLYSFCSQPNCTDGRGPWAGVVLDRSGNLYGTTAYAGANFEGGTVFKLTPAGVETVLYSFCSQSNCADGENPVASLVFDKNGILYGTTSLGGTHMREVYGGYGGGTVFKITP